MIEYCFKDDPIGLSHWESLRQERGLATLLTPKLGNKEEPSSPDEYKEEVVQLVKR